MGEDAGMLMQAPLRQRTCLERDAGMAGDMLQVASPLFQARPRSYHLMHA